MNLKQPNTERERIFDDKALSHFFLEQYGQKIAPATLRKRRCVGGGPAFFKGFGGRCYYREQAARSWIEAQRSGDVGSTSELPTLAAA